MGTTMQAKYIRISDAIVRWGVGKTKLYELIKVRAFNAVKLGSRTLIDVQSGDAYFAELPSLSPPEAPRKRVTWERSK
jgi:predicted DNA-binding transcriptional regulator AlpA